MLYLWGSREEGWGERATEWQLSVPMILLPCDRIVKTEVLLRKKTFQLGIMILRAGQHF
jgi:hypothetical protein